MEVEMNGVDNRVNNQSFNLTSDKDITDSSSNVDAEQSSVGRTYDALLSGALVNSAFEGYPFEFKTDSRSLRLYYVYRHWSLYYLLFIFLAVLHLLALWEPIGQTRNKAYFDNLTITIELLCLTYFVIRLVLRGYVTQSYTFWHDPKTIILIWTVVITLLDIVAYLALPSNKAMRWSLCLRPLFIITFAENRQIRRAIRSIRNTLPDIINVLILFFLSLGVSSLIAFKLFNKAKLFHDEKVSESLNYFDNFIDSFYQLYILVTTANNPSIMMPSYNRNRLYAIFFIIFLIINLYLFMNIILAVIYNKYRKHLKNEVCKLLQIKRDNLSRAYDIVTKGDELGMTRDQLEIIMEAVFQTWSVFDYAARHNSVIVDLVWSILETNGRIRRSDFMDIGDLMAMKIRIIYSKNSQESCCGYWLPFVYKSAPSQALIRMVHSRYFRYFFDCLIVLNVALIAIYDNHRQLKLEYYLLTAFTFEIFAKLYAFGTHGFIKSFWNAFDFIVIGLAIVFWLLISSNYATEASLGRYFDIVLVLRALRIGKIIGNIERFSVVVVTIRSLVPSIATYGILLLVLYYFYAIIGMQLFHGLVYSNPSGCSSDSIDCCPESLASKNVTMCTINFNSIASSFLLLFDLMVVNEWHTLAHNFEILAASKYTRLFFISFHVACVIIVLNIFAAFVIEAFILEYTNTTEGSVYLNSVLNKIKQLGLSSVNTNGALSTPNTKKGDPNKINSGQSSTKATKESLQAEQLDGLVDFDFNQYDDFAAYGGSSNHRSSIFYLPDKPELKVHIVERVSVESLLIRMFQKEIEMESSGL
ncbi:two pore calcium channel protein 1 [Tetranychus urticae]|uniref:two pore calcium channel protein 1 n=1 Tax=Tetranychus urticae TaxID=32264 RepID=UPI000355F0F2|nr:two pore calcium channel protein 1 [Tetranychus urticae]